MFFLNIKYFFAIIDKLFKYKKIQINNILIKNMADEEDDNYIEIEEDEEEGGKVIIFII